MKRLFVMMLAGIALLASTSAPAAPLTAEDHPTALVAVAQEWRKWRASQGGADVPDYAKRVEEQKKAVAQFRQKLEALDRSGWPIHAQVDYLVVRSEMDDLDFDLRVIRQVSRNPDFYLTEAARGVSRLIGRRYQNGPGVTVPYDAKRADAILAALRNTEAIVKQAPRCLTEAVPEMADMAIERLEDIRKNYNEFARVVGPHLPEPQRSQIASVADAAGLALEKYQQWLKANRTKMTAPYAIGRPAFEWYVQRVLMMPYNSEQLLSQAAIERKRNWAFLQFEREKNRRLPPLRPAKSNAEYSEWKDATDVLSRQWADEYELFTPPSNIGPMRDEDGAVWIEPFGLLAFPTKPIPKGERREFLVPPDHWFSHIYWELGHRIDPGTNHPHSDYPGHAFEGAVSKATTCELRRPHNTRGDAWTYYMEEAQLQLDYPFVRGPRVREWMYGLAIMRAERVYVAVKFADGSLKPDEIPDYYMKNVPGMEPYVAKKHELWRKFVDPAQVLTYQVGKFQIYELLMDRMKQLGDQFDMRQFGDALLATGQIPISLARWELTGNDDQARAFFEPRPLPSGPSTLNQ